MTVYKKAKLREKITLLDKNEFEDCFKAFNRWLKDNGYFNLVSRYIFQPGITKETIRRELLNEKSTYSFYTFADVLILLPFVDAAYKKYGPEYWTTNIAPIHSKWHNDVHMKTIKLKV